MILLLAVLSSTKALGTSVFCLKERQNTRQNNVLCILHPGLHPGLQRFCHAVANIACNSDFVIYRQTHIKVDKKT
jgi:hypothetical protein